MAKLSLFNKLFILCCIAFIIFVVMKAPHEKESSQPAPVATMEMK